MIAIESLEALLTTGNVVRHSKVPVEEPFKIPASVIAPVPVPAGNVAVAVTVFVLAEKEETVTRPASMPRVVSPTIGVPVPVPVSYTHLTLPTNREV